MTFVEEQLNNAQNVVQEARERLKKTLENMQKELSINPDAAVKKVLDYADEYAICFTVLDNLRRIHEKNA